MKLIRLEINGYKNLGEKTLFDFTNVTNYVALIGLNGSGKSNVIEAISQILYCVYFKKGDADFQYLFEYEINGNNIKLRNNQILVNNKLRKRDYNKFLPTEIISCYSGEELRMWEQIYALPYLQYFNKIKSNVIKYPLRFVYVNKYCWEISLLTLLCHEQGQQYIKDLLKIENLEDLEINIHYPRDYNYRKRLFENSTGVNALTNFVERIKENPNPLALTQISTLDLNEADNTKFCRKLFYYLFIASMPKNKKLITKIEIKFNNKDVKKLSEGEKKLILVKCMTTILAKNNSLLLLDEPDASLHIHRKKELKDIIDVENRTTILTTHSPKLLKEFDDENIFILNETENGVEVIPSKSINAIEHLTNGEFTILDVTLGISSKKDIILVEGEYDLVYINEAIKRINLLKANKFKNFDFLIINCGSAGNVPAIFREIIQPYLKEDQLCIATFDKDGAGNDGINGVKKALNNVIPSNVKLMYHTTPDDWDSSKDYFMEDYFPLVAYKPILENRIAQMSKIKDFSQLSKDTVKNIIHTSYKNFEDSHYANFELILDEFTRLQTEFKQSQQAVNP